jgi:hypothetical protein
VWEGAVSSRHDLEWVFEKSGPLVADRTVASRIAELTIAIRSLPNDWDAVDVQPQLEWLQLPNQHWRETAIWQVEQCRPPWSALSEATNGRQWLRWFMQRILSYSTFLLDDLRAGALLGLTETGFLNLIAGESELASKVLSTAYTGQLANFAGRRWWRAGVAAVAEELRIAGSSYRSRDVGAQAVAAHGAIIDILEFDEPVFTIDEEYFVVSKPVEITEAVRLQPDGWPAYADDPWLAVSSQSEETDLIKLIVFDDRELMQPGAPDVSEVQ